MLLADDCGSPVFSPLQSVASVLILQPHRVKLEKLILVSYKSSMGFQTSCSMKWPVCGLACLAAQGTYLRCVQTTYVKQILHV